MYLIAFAARVQTGIFRNAVQVGFQSVEKSLRHVAQTLLLAGFDFPGWTYGAKELDLPFPHSLKSYHYQDPAPQPQLVLPVATVEQAAVPITKPQTLHTLEQWRTCSR
jgi:hypothetical protein